MQENFISHLIELRQRLIKSILVVGIVFISLVYWASDIYKIFIYPLQKLLPANSQIVFSDVTGSFLIPIKITLMCSLLISLPWVLYQMWKFIAPALYTKERRLIVPVILSSYILFWLGILFVHFFVLPMAFKFLIAYSSSTNTPMLTSANEYLDFVLQLLLTFGIIFEIPILVIILTKIGVVDINKLQKIRPYIIVGAFVVAAIFTPPDPISQIVMAIPICLLYELGIMIAKYINISSIISEQS